jgi:hypothetical protein
VLISFSEKDSKSQQSANAMSEVARFDELVVFGDEDFGQGLRRRRQDSFTIKKVTISDQSLVWHFFHELPHGHAAGFAAEVPKLAIYDGIASWFWQMAKRAK